MVDSRPDTYEPDVSRLRRSTCTQVVTESTTVLFDTETYGDGAATARGTSRCRNYRYIWVCVSVITLDSTSVIALSPGPTHPPQTRRPHPHCPPARRDVPRAVAAPSPAVSVSKSTAVDSVTTWVLHPRRDGHIGSSPGLCVRARAHTRARARGTDGRTRGARRARVS